MAEKPAKDCPNCDEILPAGTVKCKNCGLNIHTGESYEMQVKKAKGAGSSQPPTTGRLGLTILAALGFVFLAGFLYQRGMIRTIQENPDLYQTYAERLETVDELLALGRKRDAGEAAQELKSELENQLDAIGEEDATQRRLLANLISKIDRRLEESEQ